MSRESKRPPAQKITGTKDFHSYVGRCRNCGEQSSWVVGAEEMPWSNFYSVCRANRFPAWIDNCERCDSINVVFDLVGLGRGGEP